MEDPAHPRPDRSEGRRRLWLLTALLIVSSVYLVDSRLRGREVQPAPAHQIEIASFAMPPVPAPTEAEKSVAAEGATSAEKPVAGVNAQYLRQIRQTHKLYHPIIQRVAKRYAVDPALVKAIIMAESGYDAKAVSQRGALGLMQLMPSTARSLGVADSLDPEHNITAGVRYFRQLLNLVADDPTLALAAYNAGPDTVLRYNGIPPYQATRRYIQKVMAYYRGYRQIGQHGDLTTGQG